MKICYLTYGIDPKTGWGRYASDLITGVRNRGHETIVLKESDDGLEGYVVLQRGFGIIRSAFTIRKFIKHCDIVHALDLYPYGIIAYLASRFSCVKLVITGQGTYSVAPLYRASTSWVSRLALRSCSAVTAISQYTRREMQKKAKVDIVVVNHGIRHEEFFTKRAENKTPLVLSVGVLKHRKGYHIAIPAFALVRKKFPNAKYVIVGYQRDREYFHDLKNLTKKHGVSDSVEFVEGISHEEIIKLYSRSHLFLLPSVNDEKEHHFEGFGLVFLEAASAGVPVIGTRGNGIEDAVGKNGILVKQNDVKEVTNVLISLLGDNKRRRTMSDESYKWAEAHSFGQMISGYLKVYEAL